MGGARIVRNTLALAAIAMCAGGFVGALHCWLAGEMEARQQESAERVLAVVLPARRFDRGLLGNAISVSDRELLGYSEPRLAYIARRDGRAEIVILPVVAPDAYNGAIELLVGIDREGKLSAVRALSHRETAGLGDAIELRNSPWMHGFDGKSLSDPDATRWAVKKDAGAFDQFTGATITPRAVTGAVKRALQYFAANRARLLNGDRVGHAHG